MKLDTTLENGRIKYVLEGKDLQERIAENRLDKNIGSEKKHDVKDLKTAIKQMMELSCPSIKDVRFVDKNGNEWDFKNSDGGKNGPKTVWSTDNQNALAVIRKWISNVTTKNDKGILFKWKQDEDHPVLLLLEDPNPTPNQNDSCCVGNRGTYIVGGGDCSSVIQFTPTIEYILAAGPGKGGVSGGGSSAKSAKPEAQPNSKIEQVGTQWAGSIPNNEINFRSANDLTKKSQESNAAHAKAARLFELPKTIEGELRIIGDPSYSRPLANILDKDVSIIVISPFYLGKKEDGNLDWLSRSACDPVLTNKKWMIKGVQHNITAGSYTTTLNVFLQAPNAELEPMEPFGGQGCGKIKAKNADSGGNKDNK